MPLAVADAGQRIGQVVETMRDDMDHLALALDPPVNPQHPGGEDHPTLFLIEARPDDEVGHARLILNGDEHHPLGGSGLLPDQHQARDLHRPPVAGRARVGAGQHLLTREIAPKEADRVLPHRKTHMAVVLDHLPASGHRLQRDRLLSDLRHDRRLARRCGREEGERFVAERLDRPERFAPGDPQRWPERVGLGQLDEACDRRLRPAPEVVDAGERPVGAAGEDLGRVRIR